MKKICAVIVFLMLLFNFVRSQQPLNQREKKEMIGEICSKLENHYVYPDIARKIVDTLRRSLKKRRYETAVDNAEFARLLTEDLRSVNGDLHLRADPLDPGKAKSKEDPDWADIFLKYISREKARNYGIVSVQILEENIGYLELRKLAPLNMEVKRILTGAMNFLSNTDALIIDLRRNTGGTIEMVEFLTSYFFKAPVQLTGTYHRNTGGMKASRTIKNFPYQKMSDVPLFILTGKRTISAPESFAYNLQVLKRATVVGEVTRGAANPGRFFRIREKILLLVATGYAVNPVTGTSWEGTGIQPDVKTAAEKALDKALELAKDAARAYRKKRDLVVVKYIDKLKSQIIEAERIVKQDTGKGELFLNRVADEWFSKEFINRYFFLSVGDTYRDRGETRMAVLIYKQVPRFYPDYSTGYRKLADLYWTLGEKDCALAYLVKLLERNPNDRTTLNRINQIR